ncbi:ribonuclease H-like domain-containing protein [Geranomyces variabilis]|nr:ribonuclease H-like domain-containing protein [Geranomyces variabilis]
MLPSRHLPRLLSSAIVRRMELRGTHAPAPMAKKAMRKLPWLQKTTAPAVSSQPSSVQQLNPALPPLDYNQAPGEGYKVTYVSTPADVARGLELCSGDVLGFDMEWCVPFRRGIQPTTALVQMCNDRHIVLFHISRFAVFPEALRLMLEDSSITKLGRNIKGDALKLYRDFGIIMEGSLDIASIAREVRPESGKNPSLKLLVEQVLNRTLDKGPVRVGNWEARRLSQEQIYYAGNDVYAGYRIYETLLEEAAQQANHVVRHDYFSMADYLAEREAVKNAEIKRSASDTFFEDDPLPDLTPKIVSLPKSIPEKEENGPCKNARQLSTATAEKRNHNEEERVCNGTHLTPQEDWRYSSDSDTDWALLMDGVEQYVSHGQFGVLGDKASDK